MRNRNVVTRGVVGAALFILTLVGADYARGENKSTTPTISEEDFPYPPSLRPQVEFWKAIFADYSKFHVVLHDTKTLAVYKVLDFQRLLTEEGLDEATVYQVKKEQTKIEMESLRARLLKLQQCNPNCSDLTTEEQSVWNLYRKDRDPEKFLLAADEDRLRSQTGMKDQFAEAIRISRRYLKSMEAIFVREGVPPELTRLPFIESSFNLQAFSKVGAAGIWQFMPSTGRLYNMRINHLVDERRDPLMASEAAAKFLKANYEMLGTWPLAITAYNHGPGGLATAVEEMGTSDIGTIIRRYKGDRFGFASRNFYPEFLAALMVEKNSQDHFGIIHAEAPIIHDEIALEAAVPLGVAARLAAVDEDSLIFLNPAFGSAVRGGRASIPRNYDLRIPSGTAVGFLKNYEAWQEEERVRAAALRAKRAARAAVARVHRKSGKTVIAKAKGEKRGSVRQVARAATITETVRIR
ncbi:MAG: lytic transglycosylase domain-containing protein [Deltaproteobacteria bacterium]|nr:lytic transglycosylase domain-containing protein [Deltaproteobacteria bacterium]